MKGNEQMSFFISKFKLKKLSIKILGIFVASAMLLGMFPTVSFAADVQKDPSVSEGKAAVISTDLVKWKEYYGARNTSLSFSVTITNGQKGSSGNLVVPSITCNGNKVQNYEIKADADTRGKYNINLSRSMDLASDGVYTIKIDATGADGKAYTKSVEIIDFSEDKDSLTPEGHVIFMIEKFSLGKGYYMEPKQVNIYNFDTVATVTLRALGDDAADLVQNTGNLAGRNLYISQLKDPSMKNAAINPPKYIMDKIPDADKDFNGKYANSDDWLGEFDYTSKSGWVFTQNDKGLTSSSADTKVKPNDVIRMMFTLYGTGADVGCGMQGVPESKNYRDFAPLSDLFRKLFELKNDSSLKDDPNIKSACSDASMYLQGNEQTADGVNAKLKELNDAEAKFYPPLTIDKDGNYLITSARDMRNFQHFASLGETYAGKTILLTSDIDLEGENAPWTPIDTFSGTFDGQGHVIKGLYIKSDRDGQFASMFQKLDKTAKVCSLGVEGNIVIDNHAMAGMIAGDNRGKIEKCYVKGNISSSTCMAAGGIAYEASTYKDGDEYRYGSISDCFSSVNFKFTGTSAAGYAGGIAASMDESANCYYFGTIDKGIEASPIMNQDGEYVQNTNMPTMIYNSDNITAPYKPTWNKSYIVVGTGKTTSEMKQQSTYAGYNFTNVWGIDSNKNDGYPYLRVFNGENVQAPIQTGLNIKIKDKTFDRTNTAEIESITLSGVKDGDDVTVDYEVKSAEFKSVDVGNGIAVTLNLKSAVLKGKDKDKYVLPLQMSYNLTGNIVERPSSLPYNKELQAYTISNPDEFKKFADESRTWNNFKGKRIVLLNDIDLEGSADNIWSTPICKEDKNYENYGFAGTFDGNGKAIKNLYLKNVDKDGDSKADFKPSLFEYVSSEGSIRNLSLENVQLDAASTFWSSDCISSLVQTNLGTISNCKVQGKAFYNGAANDNTSSVSGFVQANYGTIINCLSDVDFDIVSDSNRGEFGIAQFQGKDWKNQHYGEIENCVVEGKMNQTTSDADVSVYPVTRESQSDASNYKVNNVYYDNSNCKPYISTDKVYQAGTNLSTSDMKNKDKLTDLDFNRYWSISKDVNSGLPYLKLFGDKNAKPLTEVGIQVKVKDKDYDGTTDGQIDSVTLTGVADEDKDKLSVDYVVDSVKFADSAVGENKNVTVLFKSLVLKDTDGVTANKYELVTKTSYTAAASIKSISGKPVDKAALMKSINHYLDVYFKGIAVKSPDSDFVYDPQRLIEWNYIDYGLGNEYVNYTDKEKEAIKYNWEHYLAGLKEYVKNNTVPSKTFTSTVYDKILMAMSAFGYDPNDFKEANLLDTMSRKDFGNDGMMMGKSYGIIAMDSGGYDYKSGSDYDSRDNIIKDFSNTADLKLTLPPKTTVSDFLTMGVQCYIPYYNPNAKQGDADYNIKLYFDNLINQLSIAQQDDGKFGNSYTTDQVVILLAGLGVDVISDPRFIKNGNTCLNVILDTLNPDTDKIGGTMLYEHAEALMAVLKQQKGERNSIYVMNDIISDKTQAVIDAINALPDSITEGNRAQVESARKLYDALRKMEQNNVINYEKLVMAEYSLSHSGVSGIKLQRIGTGELQKDTSADISFNVTNDLEINDKITLELVLCKKGKDADEIINFSYVTKVLKAGEKENFKGGFIIPKEGDYYIKVIAWDNFNTDKMNMLASPVIINVN